MNSYNIRARYYLLALPLAAAIILTESIGELLGRSILTSATTYQESLTPEDLWLEAARRWELLASTILLACIALISVCFAVYLIWISFRLKPPPLMIATLLTASLIWKTIYSATTSGGTPNDIAFLGFDLFVSASSGGAQDARNLWNADTLSLILITQKLMIGIITISTASSFIICLRTSQKGTRIAYQLYGERIYQRTLYIASAGLAAGIIASRTFYNYPTFMIENEYKSVYVQVVNSFTLYGGTGYSIALGSIAVPAALLLERRADRISARYRSSRAVAANYTGSVSNAWGAIKTLTAICVPLAVGSASTLLEAVA